MANDALKSTDSLVGVCETLLIPLAARVVESQSESAAFRDPCGVAFASRLNFNPSEVARDRWNKVGCQARTVILDEAVNHILSRAPRTTVINLGAGLCTRFWRVQAAESLRWYDLDLPSVMEMKQGLLKEIAPHAGVPNRHFTGIAADVTDHAWMNQIRTSSGEQVLIIAEGVLMYLKPEDVRQLLCALADRYPGADLLLEAWSPFVRRIWATLSPALRRTGASLHWGLDDPGTIEGWDPRIRLQNEWRPGDWQPHRWGLLRFTPRLRRSLTKILHFQLGKSIASQATQGSAA